jgi:hypothetical protein
MFVLEEWFPSAHTHEYSWVHMCDYTNYADAVRTATPGIARGHVFRIRKVTDRVVWSSSQHHTTTKRYDVLLKNWAGVFDTDDTFATFTEAVEHVHWQLNRYLDDDSASNPDNWRIQTAEGTVIPHGCTRTRTDADE